MDLKFEPHISLLYGIYSKNKKIKESLKLKKINKKIIKVDKIAIVEVNEEINKCEIIERIKLKDK